MWVPIVLWIAALFTSKVKSQEDYVFVADRGAERIYQFHLNGTRVRSVLPGSDSEVLSLDYDPLINTVFWFGKKNFTIFSEVLESTERKDVLKLTRESDVQGLAVDPTLQLLFFSDAGTETISVLSYDPLSTSGTHRVLITGLSKPRDVQLDRVNKFVYWSDYETNRIERCRYDGSQRQLLVSTANNTWFNGIALDVTARLMYFVEAKEDRIAYVNMDDGSGLRDLVPENASDFHPYALAKAYNTLIYNDWRDTTTHIKVFDLTTNSTSEFARFSFVMVTGIVTYIPTSRTSEPLEGPCLTDRGGCNQLCLPLDGADAYKCACTRGFDLLPDNKTCTSVEPFASGPDVVWLEHDDYGNAYIRGITGQPADFTSQENVATWSYRNLDTRWIAMDLSAEHHLLFLVDQYERTLYEMNLNNSLRLRAIEYGLSSQVYGLAYDWIADNLYYTDALFNWIKVVQRKPPSETRVLVNNVSEPHDIAINLKLGIMIWTDWGVTPAIEAARLNGSERRVVVSDNVYTPTGITVDMDTDIIYWADRGGIYSCNLDGTNRALVIAAEQHNFVDIKFYEGFIMATDKGNEDTQGQVLFYKLNSNSNQSKSIPLDRSPSGIIMFDSAVQPKPNVGVGNDCFYRCGNIWEICITESLTEISCICSEGKDAREGGGCIQEDTDITPQFIYSMGNKICRISSKAAMKDVINPECFFESNRNDFRAMDYDYKNGILYFADVRSTPHVIIRATLHQLQRNRHVVIGVGLVYGMAIDWMSDNLYWSDAEAGEIWISRASGAYQRLLIRNLSHPQAMLIDMRRRHLYWSETDTLKRSNLDGSDVQIFMSGVGNVTDMVISYVEDFRDRIYWLDASAQRVHSAYTDGTDFSLVPINITGGYGLALIEDHLAVSTMSDGQPRLVIYDLPDGQNPSSVTPISGTNIFNVIGYYENNQPLNFGTGISTCTEGVSVCDQLCLQNATWWYCACMDGLRYDESISQCTAITRLQENFLLIADDYRHIIYQVNERNPDQIAAVKVPALDRPIGMAYDFQQHLIFWTDLESGTIKKTSLFDSVQEAVVVKRGVSRSRIDGIAVDPLSKLVFYTDTIRHTVGVINYSGTMHKVLLNQPNLNGRVNPRDIALDLTRSHMYITTRFPDYGAILRADMDGRNLVTLVGNLDWPNGLDIDIPGNKMYFVDSHTEKIIRATLNGTNEETIHKASGAADPFSLVKVGNSIYWTDWSLRGLFRMNLDDLEADREVLNADFYLGLNDIVYFKDAQTMSQWLGDGVCGADNGGCSDLCIPVPSGRQCACADAPNGAAVVPGDGINCDVPSCPTTIAGGTFSRDCTFMAGSRCSFLCNAGKGYKTAITELTCGQNLQWDRDVSQLCDDRLCPPLEIPDNTEGSCTNSDLLRGPGYSCSLLCSQGYLGNSAIKTCVARDDTNIVWEGNDVTCTHRGFCPAITIANATLSPSGCTRNDASHVGSTCYINCNEGFELQGSGSAICLSSNDWSALPMCQRGPAPKAQDSTKKKEGDSIAVPVAIGVLLVVFFIAAVLLVALFYVKRQNKKGAKYRQDQQGFSETEGASGIVMDEINPSYDVKQDSVHLDGSRAFENPMYKNTENIQQMTERMRPEEVTEVSNTKPPLTKDHVQVEINSNIPSNHSGNQYEMTNSAAPNSLDNGGVSINSSVSSKDRTAFTNPMYDTVHADSQMSVSLGDKENSET